MSGAVVLACAVLAASAGAGTGVKGVKDCTKPVNRPSRIVLGCADFSLYVNSIHWDSWTSKTATGSGVLQENDCTPDCATGTFHQYPVDITLSKPKQTTCGHKTVTIFRRVSMSFPGDSPAHPGRFDSAKLSCL